MKINSSFCKEQRKIIIIIKRPLQQNYTPFTLRTPVMWSGMQGCSGGVPGTHGQGRLGPLGRSRRRGRAPGIGAPSSARPAIPGRSRPFPVRSRPFPVRSRLPLTHLPGPFPPRAGRAQPLPRPREAPQPVRGGPGRCQRRGREGKSRCHGGVRVGRGLQILLPQWCVVVGVVFWSTEPLKQCLNCRWFLASTPRCFMLVINSSIRRLV